MEPVQNHSGLQPDGSLGAPVARRIGATVVASPLLQRYTLVAGIGFAVSALGAYTPPPVHQALHWLWYPAVAWVARAYGLNEGLALTGGALAAALVWQEAAPGGGGVLGAVVFWLSLGLVAWVVGRLRDSLTSAMQRADAEKTGANEFAAALHLRLVLAEKELERLRVGGQARGSGPAPASLHSERNG